MLIVVKHFQMSFRSREQQNTHMTACEIKQNISQTKTVLFI